MSKRIKLKKDNYLDSTSIVHGNKMLSNIINKLTQDTGWVKLTLTNGTNANGWKPVVARRKGNVVQITGAVKGLEREWQPILTLPEEFRPNFYRAENEGVSTFQYITPCINNPKHTQCLNLSAGGVLNVTTVFGRTLSINDEIQLDITYLV